MNTQQLKEEFRYYLAIIGIIRSGPLLTIGEHATTPDRETPALVHYHRLSSLIANMLLVKAEQLSGRCAGPTCVQYFSIFTL